KVIGGCLQDGENVVNLWIVKYNFLKVELLRKPLALAHVRFRTEFRMVPCTCNLTERPSLSSPVRHRQQCDPIVELGLDPKISTSLFHKVVDTFVSPLNLAEDRR